MSKQPKNINKSGFTIIEVVLVLAIAGLIFLMVFVAFPALQRNQRDTRRREDYAMLESQIISASSTTGGKVPTGAAYKIGEDGNKDPSGKVYNIAVVDKSASASASAITSSTGSSYNVYIVHNANGSYCKDDGKPADYSSTAKNDKSFAIYAPLENGTYCRTASI